MNETELLQRITVNPEIFSGKPIIRGRRLAVEHVLGMLAADDDFETILEGYPWLRRGGHSGLRGLCSTSYWKRAGLSRSRLPEELLGETPAGFVRLSRAALDVSAPRASA